MFVMYHNVCIVGCMFVMYHNICVLGWGPDLVSYSCNGSTKFSTYIWPNF